VMERERVNRRHAKTKAEFDLFVTESAEGLLRTASLMTWDVAAAEDLVQECFLRVSRRWPRVRTMEHPKAFARTVLVNLALDDGRRRSRHRAELNRSGSHHVQDHEDDGAVRVLSRVEASADLTRALAGLPRRQRIALVLRYFDDLTEAETARTLGCSVGTVKSQHARAMARLRELIPQQQDGSTT
jgi:RNA polymerase sigma-70 factor (sigma-E family)